MSFIIDSYRYSGFTGLLDTYGSATVAYSVRWLNSAYTGALVRIRRSSDSAEKDFYPDSNNELSMSSEDGAGTSLSTWISTDSGYIRTWYDQSGNSNDAPRSVAADQPRIVNAGTLETDPNNGKASLYFDGTNDFLNLTSSIATTQLFYQHFVFNRPSAGTYSIALTAPATANPFTFIWWTDNTIYSGMGTGSTVHETSQTQTGDFLSTMLRDSSNNVKMWRNGSADTTKTVTNSAANFTGVGNRTGTEHQNHTQELIYWNSDQESNRSGIESDTNTFFGIW